MSSQVSNNYNANKRKKWTMGVEKVIREAADALVHSLVPR